MLEDIYMLDGVEIDISIFNDQEKEEFFRKYPAATKKKDIGGGMLNTSLDAMNTTLDSLKNRSQEEGDWKNLIFNPNMRTIVETAFDSGLAQEAVNKYSPIVLSGSAGLIRSTADLFSNAIDLRKGLYDSVTGLAYDYGVSEYVTDDNVRKQLEDPDKRNEFLDQSSEILDKIISYIPPGLTKIPVNVDFKGVSNVFKTVSSAADVLVKKGGDYDLGVLGALQEGKFDIALDNTVQGVFQAIPSAVAVIYGGPGGMALIGTSAAGQHYEELAKANPDDRGASMFATSLAQGGVELASEAVTRGLAKGLYTTFGGKVNNLDEVFKTGHKMILGKIAKSAFYEGSSEVAAQEINNMIDEKWGINRFYDENGEFDGSALLRRTFDTFLISSFIGGGIGGKVGLTQNQTNLMYERMTPDDIKKENKSLANRINQLNSIYKETKDTSILSEIKALQNKIYANKIKVGKIVEQMDPSLKKQYLENLTSIDDAALYIKNGKLDPRQQAYYKGVITKLKNKNSKYYSFAEAIANELGLQENIQFTKDYAEDKGYKSPIIAKTPEEFAEKSGQDASADGAFVDGQIYINETVARQKGAISVGSHELLHRILQNSLLDPNQRVKLINEFKTELEKRGFHKIVQKRIDDNYKLDEQGNERDISEYAEEYLTSFSDAIVKGDIVYDEGFFENIGRTVIEPLFRKIPAFRNVKFNTGKDVFDFVKNYSLNVQAGRQTTGVVQDERGEDKEAAKSISRQAAKARDELNKFQDGTTNNDGSFNKAKFLENVKEGERSIQQTLKGMVEAKGKALIGKGLKMNLNEYTAQTLAELLFRGDLNKFNGTGQLYGYMNQRIKFASLDAFENNPTIVDNFDNLDLEKIKNVVGEDLPSLPGETNIVEDVEGRKINPTSIIKDPVLRKKYVDLVKEKLKSRTAKSIADSGLGLEVLAEITGVPLAKLRDDAKNLTYKDEIVTERNLSKIKEFYPDATVGMIIKSEAGKIQDFIKTNPDSRLFLPPENVIPDDTQRDIKGLSIKIKSSLLKSFYKSTGRRSKGVTSQVGVKELIQEKVNTPENFNAEFGIVKGQPDTYDRAIGQKLKGYMNLIDKMMTNFLEGETVIPARKQAIRAGKPKALLSKNVNDIKYSEQGFGLEEGDVSGRTAKAKDSKSPIKRRGSRFSDVNEIQEVSDVYNAFLKLFPQYANDFRVATTNGGGRSIYESVDDFDNRIDIQVVSDVTIVENKDGKKVEKQIPFKVFPRDKYSKNKKQSKEFIDKVLKDPVKYAQEQVAKARAYVKFFEDAQTFLNRKRTKEDKTTKEQEIWALEELINDAKNQMDHFLRVGSKINFIYVDDNKKPIFDEDITEEHTGVTVGIGRTSLLYARDNIMDKYGRIITATYMQGALQYLTDKQLGRSLAKGGVALGRKMGQDFSDLMNALAEGEIKGTEIELFSIARYLDPRLTRFNPNRYLLIDKNKTMTEHFNVNVPPKLRSDVVIAKQKELMLDVLFERTSKSKAKQIINKFAAKEAVKRQNAAKKSNASLSVSTANIDNVYDQIDMLAKIDKAVALSKTANRPKKGISVFDFDDTLAQTKSKVIVTMPQDLKGIKAIDKLIEENREIGNRILAFRNEQQLKARKKEIQDLETQNSAEELRAKLKNAKGENKENIELALQEKFKRLPQAVKDAQIDVVTGKVMKITPAEFAARSEQLELQGATFDFSEFNKVVDGTKGPLADLALKRQGKFGSGDIFVLTARPQASAKAIQKFLKGIGLNIPLQNITGLEDGRPQAKANWIIGKVSEGYNDFYFADDALKNVSAVKQVLDQADVKSDVQQALLSRSKTVDREFNDIIEQKTGVEWFKEYSSAKARRLGRRKGLKLIMPFSTQDFQGLIKHITPSGKEGDIAEQWFEEKLFRPFARAEAAIARDEVAVGQDYKQLKKLHPSVPKTLHEEAIDGFTYSDVVRVYIWNKQGYEIEGLSNSDLKQINNFINEDSELKSFANSLESIQKGRPYPKPDVNWQAGTITTDVVEGIRTVNRSEYLQEWQQNVDEIFSEKNKNKLQAKFGTAYINSLENMLDRMKAGKNRINTGNSKYSSITSGLMDWVNGSVGAIMFLNVRTSALQLISNVNFLNWSDNNIYEAGKAVANVPQYVKDIKFLMNSPMLVKRRQGLRINVAESELADASRRGGIRGIIALLLRKGFVLTQIADSLAIATGGAPMYRNRVKTYLREGFDQKTADERAYLDFQEIAEETQQSSRTDRISMQQASDIGRLVLAFANTPMQYNRLIQKSVSDLVNRRGDARTHISKILYYSTVQNFIFNALQQALYSLSFHDDNETFDEEQLKKFKDKKIFATINGMVDSLLRGGGYIGAGASAIKNTLVALHREGEKPNPEYDNAAIELLKFSPPISSKYQRVTSALRTVSWESDEIVEKGFSLENPALLAGGQLLSAFTNIPLDRAIRKMNNVNSAINSDHSAPIRIMSSLGWSEADMGVADWQIEKREKERIKKAKERFKNNPSKWPKLNLNRKRTKLNLRKRKIF
jgi:hypothetical protein